MVKVTHEFSYRRMTRYKAEWLVLFMRGLIYINGEDS